MKINRQADLLGVPERTLERIWLTRKDAAAYLGVSPDFIKRLNLTGNLGFSKVGGLVFINKSELDRLLQNNRIY